MNEWLWGSTGQECQLEALLDQSMASIAQGRAAYTVRHKTSNGEKLNLLLRHRRF